MRGVGRLRYTRSPDHEHWHLLHFDRYELRRPGGDRALVRDRKTGFCLGDRYGVDDPALAAKPPEAVYRSRCGLERPGLWGVREGISVGYGDDYDANLEGQYLRLSGLRAGRYLLVHRANADRRLLRDLLRQQRVLAAAAAALAQRRAADPGARRVPGPRPLPRQTLTA